MWDIVVIGGGYTGVTAALQVEAALPDAKVLLLEASDRLGGRAFSYTAPTHPGAPAQSLDHGAHYLGMRQKRIYALAQRLLSAGQLFNRVPMYGPDPAFRSFLEGTWRITVRSESFLGIQGLRKDAPLYDRVCIFKSLSLYLALENLVNTRAPWRTPFAGILDRITLAQWIERQRVPQWIREMWGLGCLGIISMHPEHVSLLYWLWYCAANDGFLNVANDVDAGPQQYSVDIGLGGLLQQYAAALRGTVKLNSPVVQVDHSAASHVTITTADGTTCDARRVVVAVTPQAAGRHITFTPPLHPARQALHQQPTGHAAKATLFYDRPWWRDAQGRHLFGMSAGPLAQRMEWVLDTSHPDGRQYSLTAFVNHQLFAGLAPDADEAALHAALAAGMAEITGDEQALHPQCVAVFRWRDAPYVGGGPNTSFQPGVLSQAAPVFNQPEGAAGRLYFAGSEYATEGAGYVEGAMAAGEFVAAQMIYDAARTGDFAAGSLPSAPVLPGHGPRLLSSLIFLTAWALLAPITELVGWFSGRRR